jgi:hypothetical protein
MKKLLVLFLLIMTSRANAQSDEKQALIEKVQTFNKAVFFDKDSISLDRMLAKQVTYGHSGGKVEDRKEMIHAAVTNKSTYSQQNTSDINVLLHGKTAVVRHLFTATETKEGQPSPLKLKVMQVWVKEKKEWRLMARQAVKVQ